MRGLSTDLLEAKEDIVVAQHASSIMTTLSLHPNAIWLREWRVLDKLFDATTPCLGCSPFDVCKSRDDMLSCGVGIGPAREDQFDSVGLEDGSFMFNQLPLGCEPNRSHDPIKASPTPIYGDQSHAPPATWQTLSRGVINLNKGPQGSCQFLEHLHVP